VLLFSLSGCTTTNDRLQAAAANGDMARVAELLEPVPTLRAG